MRVGALSSVANAGQEVTSCGNELLLLFFLFFFLSQVLLFSWYFTSGTSGEPHHLGFKFQTAAPSLYYYYYA
jgi:hypothetical protein